MTRWTTAREAGDTVDDGPRDSLVTQAILLLPAGFCRDRARSAPWMVAELCLRQAGERVRRSSTFSYDLTIIRARSGGGSIH